MLVETNNVDLSFFSLFHWPILKLERRVEIESGNFRAKRKRVARSQAQQRNLQQAAI